MLNNTQYELEELKKKVLQPGRTLESDQKYTYSTEGVETTQQVASAMSKGFQILSIVAILVSFKVALMMLKLFQMLEFLTLFNVNYPTNVRVFLSAFSLGNPIKNIPNPF